MFNSPPVPPPDMLFATILRRRRRWWVMWIGRRADVPPDDIRDATLTAAVDRASAAAAQLCRANPANATAELQFMIFGRSKPTFEGPQLQVAGEPGEFTATDVRDQSVHYGATLEDLVSSAGGNPAEPGDYALLWNRAVLTGPRDGASDRT